MSQQFASEETVVEVVGAVRDELMAEILKLHDLAAEVFGPASGSPAIGILGPAKPAGPAPKGKAQEATTPQAVGIHEIARRSGEVAAKRRVESEERRQRMDTAYKEFLAACTDAGFAFVHEAYADMEIEGADCKAITYLQRLIADEKIIISEAIEYAKEREWLVELTTFQRVLITLREVNRKVIVRKAKVNGDELDVHARFEQAFADGEISTLEDVLVVAEEGGWLRDYDPERITVRDKLEAERDADEEQLRRQEGRRGKPPAGNRGKRTRGKGH